MREKGEVQEEGIVVVREEGKKSIVMREEGV